MKVAFVVDDLRLSGGVGVVVEHARRLNADHGFDVDLVLARQDEAEWAYRGLGDVSVVAMPQAREERYDVAVATWWETVADALALHAERHAYFLQSLEDRFYMAHEPQRLGAAVTHDLPLPVITEARWIAREIEALRPAARVLLVRNGVDKDVFGAPSEPEVRRDGPLRVLIEGSPHVWFKGVPAAVGACGAMREERHVTLVGAGAEGWPGVDRAIEPVAQAELAALYREADVLLKLSAVEGMSGPPLEGFHCGATCVVTPVTGHDEYVAHGFNGLVTDWDDERGTARLLDLLARDRALLHELRLNAVRTARAWPSWSDQAHVMAAALRAIRREPPPRAFAGAVELLGDVGAAVEHTRRAIEERDRLRYRVAPLVALERALERRPLRWIARPLRRAWGALRRRRSA